MAVKNCFLRGSVIRYVQVPAKMVDTELLQDAARREYAQAGKAKKPTNTAATSVVVNENK